MLLEDEHGKLLRVDKVVVKHQNSTVYNFKVEGYHTYYVSNLHVWTHNECAVELNYYERARNEALSWLEQRGFKAEKQTLGKFGDIKNKPIGMQTNDGKIGFRIEFDNRSGAHINDWAGKEKGPHFEFDVSEKTVKKIQKLFR